jgi:two-component system NarL family response regulator
MTGADACARPIRTLLADDHEVVREGLAAMLLLRRAEFEVVAEANDGIEAEGLYRAQRPDVAILDLRMPRRDGLDTVKAIRAFDPAACILMLTTYDSDEDIYQALRAGARGYLLKDAAKPDILEAIRMVARGQKVLPSVVASRLSERLSNDELSPRELDVLKGLAEGLSNKRIAAALGITEGTVKAYANTLYAKLGVASRSGAIAIAAKRGLVRLTRS